MHNIPILDLKKQIRPIRKQIDKSIKEVIDSAEFIFGKPIEILEKKTSEYCKVKYAVGVSNCTDALRLALISLGIKRGDGVICPAFTFFATAGAIAAIGAIPVFTDINPLTYNISLSSIKDAFSRKRNLRIKAVIPVHLYGQCADMDGIVEFSRRHALKIVEDTAQAFGAEYKGGKAGSFGDCAAVSFFPGKNLGAFGDAGMVLTNNKRIADTLLLLRNQGNKHKYNHLILGFNNRLDTLNAAVLLVKLKYYDSWNKKRRENAEYYNKELRGLELQTPFVPSFNKHIYHQYVLRLNSSSRILIEHLRHKGIDARVYYPLPLHLQKCFSYLGYHKGDFPESEKASIQTLAIPVYPDLTMKEKDFVINSIKEFLQ